MHDLAAGPGRLAASQGFQDDGAGVFGDDPDEIVVRGVGEIGSRTWPGSAENDRFKTPPLSDAGEEEGIQEYLVGRAEVVQPRKFAKEIGWKRGWVGRFPQKVSPHPA